MTPEVPRVVPDTVLNGVHYEIPASPHCSADHAGGAIQSSRRAGAGFKLLQPVSINVAR